MEWNRKKKTAAGRLLSRNHHLARPGRGAGQDPGGGGRGEGFELGRLGGGGGSDGGD